MGIILDDNVEKVELKFGISYFDIIGILVSLTTLSYIVYLFIQKK